jgi:hypothetical protein
MGRRNGEAKWGGEMGRRNEEGMRRRNNSPSSAALFHGSQTRVPLISADFPHTRKGNSYFITLATLLVLVSWRIG